jgi:hypothetical protein
MAEARIIREQNTRCREERRAEVTQEERILGQQINVTHQKAAITQRVLRFMGTATEDLEVSHEQVHRHQLSPMEEISQVCQAVQWKDETANSCRHSGKVVLATLYDPPQQFKHLLEDPLFLVKFSSYNSVFAFTSMGASLMENFWIDEQLANPRQGVYMFRVQGTICLPVRALLPL